jgi:hypothetical protein
MTDLDGIDESELSVISIDNDGFLWCGDFRLPIRFDPETEMLEFFDKDRRRSQTRGTQLVEVPLRSFFNLRD